MPTSADPFIEVQDVIDRAGRGSASDPGAVSAVDGACDMVRTLAEQTFNEDTSTIDLDGTGTDTIILPELPVNSVTSVKVINSDGTTAVTGYALNGHGVISRTRGAAVEGCVWPAGRQNIRVTYQHGYEEVPRDVREVALDIAVRLVTQGPANREALGDASIDYGMNATDFTKGERAILHKYRQLG